MAREQLSPAAAERRCPNCGTRVARDAESCFMCGHDLRITPRRRQRIAIVDALLVLAVVAVLVLWWQIGSRPPQELPLAAGQTIGSEQLPVLTPDEASTPAALPTATPTPLSPTTTYIRHQVLTGETLLSIAGEYGVTVDEIQGANNLADALIRAGDVLIIPVLQTVPANAASAGPTSRFQYTVRSGDTIVSIAVNFGSTVEEILSTNNLAANAIIRPGDELTIPLREPPTEVLASAAESVVTTTTTTTQSVVSTAETIYVEPRLIGPPDQSVIVREEAVLFRWISVDVLAPNEWYVLLIYPETTGAQRFPTIWTKSTSYRLGPEFAPAIGTRADYAWQVSLARVKTDADGQMIIEAASPASSVRRFTWQ